MPAKTSDAVRKAVLKDYLTGTESQQKVAGRHGVPMSTFQMWLKAERGKAPIAKMRLADDDEPAGNGAVIEEAIEEARKVQAARALVPPLYEEHDPRVRRLEGENARLRRLVQTLLEMQIQGPE
jgi:transposase-like protein